MIDWTIISPIPALWVVFLLLPIKIWAAWEAAKRDQVGWFVLFFLVWFYGIPEVIYLVWFRAQKRLYW